MLGERGRRLVDELAGVSGDDGWFAPTPAWSFWPTERMDNDMYGWQQATNPLDARDPHLPAVIRERALDLVLRR